MDDETCADLAPSAQQQWRSRVRASAPSMDTAMDVEKVESLEQVLACARRSSGVNWARVGELRHEIATGRYRIEVERLASSLITEARMMS